MVALFCFAANALVFKVPFFPYDRILSAVSDCSGLVWNREDGIRLDVGGIHDSVQVYYPKVVHTLDGYRMYYRAGGNNAFIGSAYSHDGLSWREEPGIRIGLEGGDIGRIEGCEVVFLDGKWHMYYSEFDGRIWRIFHSTSPDGLIWARGLCCINSVNDIELPHVKAPSIVDMHNGWRMYFMKFSLTTIRIYTSFSQDGNIWSPMEECKGILKDGRFVRNPCVRQMQDGKLRMYFSERNSSVNPVGGRIISAVSHDGLSWHREGDTRIGLGRNEDKHGVFSADLLAVEGGWRMYYTGYWGRHWLEPLTLYRYKKAAAQ